MYPKFGSVESCPKCGRFRCQNGNATTDAEKNNLCGFKLAYCQISSGGKEWDAINVTCDKCFWSWEEHPLDAELDEVDNDKVATDGVVDYSVGTGPRSEAEGEDN